MKLLLSLLLLTVNTSAQPISRAFMENWAKARDTSLHLNNSTAFLIDNINYKVSEVDSILSRWTIDSLLDFQFINGANRMSNVIIIDSRRQQTKSKIYWRLKWAMTNKDFADAEIYYNDKLIPVSQLKDLPQRDIRCIVNSHSPTCYMFTSKGKHKPKVIIFTKNEMR